MEKIKSVEKVKLLVTLKTDEGIYPKGKIFEAPFPKGIIDEIALDRRTIESLYDESPPELVSDASADDDHDVAGEVKEKQISDPASGKKISDAEMKKALEAFVLELDPEINLDRRKGLKTLKKMVAEIIVEKAAENFGVDLNPNTDVEVLMKSYSELKDARASIDIEDI